jgi:pimeloyl-ACP methyl ester carboxylesterase
MYKYKGIQINYKEYGTKGNDAIVYLHGWGQNIQMMEPIANPFEKTNHLVIIDLPGFGASEEPKDAWSLDDYVDMIHELLTELKIDNPNLVGHSFGGKLSLLYSTKYKTRRIVLLASPYKVKMNPESTKLKLLKKIKKIPVLGLFADFAKKFMGSTDYKNASPRMREILVKHVNTDLTDKLDKVQCPTLLIWGTADAAVPYEDAVELEKLIKDAGLVTYEGATHYAYLERLQQTINVLKSFIK